MERKQRQLAEEQKKKEEKKKELKRLQNEQLRKQEDEITVAETEQRKALGAFGVLLQETEGKLSDAIKAGNMEQVSVAHALEIARKRMSEACTDVVLTKRNVTLTHLCTRSPHRQRKRSPASMMGKSDDVHIALNYGTDYIILSHFQS